MPFFFKQVIVSFQVSPKACQGSNRYSCTYTLIDMTKPNPHNPVSLNIFADEVEDFPKCIRAGDIIRCMNVMVEIRGGYSKLIGNPRNKSTYVTFSRKVNFLTSTGTVRHRTGPTRSAWRKFCATAAGTDLTPISKNSPHW